MLWNHLFPGTIMPSPEDMAEFIGPGVPLWVNLRAYLEEAYKVKPVLSYSKCAAQPGWNMKYQKNGKSLCTLYPMEGFFIALVVIGAKEEPVVEGLLETFTPYVAGMYQQCPFTCGGRWLMIHVTDEAVLEDVKNLIAARVKPIREASSERMIRLKGDRKFGDREALVFSLLQ